MAKNTTKKITSIGGSALIEGIMMRGPKRTTVCVRTAPDKIYSEDISINTIPSKCKLFKLPFLRGIAGLIDSMRLSYKALMLSADKAIESTEIEEEPSKFEKWLDDKFGDKLVKVMMVFASILGVALAVGLFFFVPSFLFDLSANVVPAFKGDGGNAVFWKSVFEGVLKIILFLLYIIVCSQMTEMKRVFMYHGAEHKTIACYEAGDELTVENVRKYTRFHPRCGTSFLILVVIVSVFLYSVLPWSSTGLRVVFKLLLLPVVMGISYELLKWCGRSDNIATRIIRQPGIWVQHLTVFEPDDSMIEVAIAAVTPVLPEKPEDGKW